MGDTDLGPWTGEGREKPEAVAEAEADVRRLGWSLTAAGVGGTAAYWLHAFILGFPVLPMSWWGIFLVALVLAFFFPQTRKAQRAREILRQWDRAQVGALLERSGSSTDPRLQSAERMVKRIHGHPGGNEELRAVASELLQRLRETTGDERVIEVMQAASRGDPGGAGDQAALPDLRDYLEARAGRLLGALAELHGALVKRDRSEVSEVLDQASQVLRDLRASDDVDRLLSGEGE